MSERPLDVLFSLADAELPAMHLESGSLRLEFVDWRARRVSVTFEDVVHASWTYRDVTEGVFEREDSTLVGRLLDEAAIQSGENLRHLQLRFNEGGELDVVARQFDSSIEDPDER